MLSSTVSWSREREHRQLTPSELVWPRSSSRTWRRRRRRGGGGAGEGWEEQEKAE
jgi:hypothetical protein